jgi:hypothetical protein
MFQMLGVFAEFERAMIRERVLSGMARAPVPRARAPGDRSAARMRSTWSPAARCATHTPEAASACGRSPSGSGCR